MAQIQKTIFLLCIATVYAAIINNISDENVSAEMEESMTKDENAGQISDDPTSPSFVVSDELQSNGFQMGKSIVEGILGLLQIVRQMAMSQEGLKNMSFLLGNMVSMFAGRYYETLKRFMPVFSGMVTALLETLR
ncbi:uncharacterized protein LOC133525121 [Cydia pomonella]|uniref:uncharacterized protein LOC133525121 n=1 Tax=Cydia pomonella TaxID=82600 RepID=UPI002ADD4163|nr:uncharacterized protein LOC133525121 [Cydia pomonella]